MNTTAWQTRLAILAAGAALALAPLAPAGASPAPDDAKPAPLHGTDSATAIAGEYIVVLTDDSTDARVQDVSAAAVAAGATIKRSYGHAIKGFAGTLPADALAAVRASAGVEFVEADARISLPTLPIAPTDRPAELDRVQDVQPDPTWGLDRIDQRGWVPNGKYKYDSTGLGVTAYIIDSGIRTTHTDFEGRATSGFSAIDDGNGTDDCNGHGTHVAGTVGGAEYGVAKEVDLVAVRVLDCAGNGTNAGVIDGVDWVTEVAPVKAVANMSLGSPDPSPAMNKAVKRSITAGIPYAVAAGNDAVEACTFSPAKVTAAITVAALDYVDYDAWFSNYGSCVDLYAPGVEITSAWHTSNSATETINGTSMAAPHVAGAIALYLELHPNATTGEIRSAIVGGASKGKITFWYGTGSPNKLLFSRID